jgi:hypothetical protein
LSGFAAGPLRGGARPLAAILLAATLAPACARNTAVAPSVAPAAASLPPRVDESTLPLEEVEAIPEPGAAASRMTPGASASEAARADALDGYRVQLYATADQMAAETMAARARTSFREPVYVENQPPLFKVRVGDFLTRDEASGTRERAIDSGFADAWIVEARVNRRGGAR